RRTDDHVITSRRRLTPGLLQLFKVFPNEDARTVHLPICCHDFAPHVLPHDSGRRHYTELAAVPQDHTAPRSQGRGPHLFSKTVRQLIDQTGITPFYHDTNDRLGTRRTQEYSPL